MKFCIPATTTESQSRGSESDQARTYSGKQSWHGRDRSYLPDHSGNVETNAMISEHGKQMKEDAADGETSKSRHAADCETGSRFDLLDDGADDTLVSGRRDGQRRTELIDGNAREQFDANVSSIPSSDRFRSRSVTADASRQLKVRPG
jgi:hypothetical protein